MTQDKIRKKFIDFFTKEKHHPVPSSSLLPQNDPSVLLTTAGMQQFKPYFMGEKDVMKNFKSNRLISIQKCFRTSDIEEVGDAWHCTFFEMLGNFSFGHYFKEEAIDLAWRFLVKELGIKKENLWATYFKGDKKNEADLETKKLWQKYLPAEKILGFGKDDNWWGPPGKSGPCGPCSEIHYDFTGQPCEKGKKCLPNCNCGRFMELWNLVFMQYHMNEKGETKDLPKKNIDTGMGLERLALILQKKKSIYETDFFSPIMEIIANDKIFGKMNTLDDIVRSRILADHMKGSVFLRFDDIIFSNKEQGYILRRVFRRAVDQYLYPEYNFDQIVEKIIEMYSHYYPFLSKRKQLILDSFHRENEAYQKIHQQNVEETLKKIQATGKKKEKSGRPTPSSRKISATEAFQLYTTYGFSLEKLKREGFEFEESEFNKLIEKHKELSKAGATKKFGGHGLDSKEWKKEEKEKITKLHTATHLLQQALREVLGKHVRQEGSDINPERLRFDFSHPNKLTDEEKKKVEDLVNQKIKEDLKIDSEEMPYQDAINCGALAFFKEKYPEKVKVYSAGDFSKEICGGPHIKSTGEIGKFKIISEKSSSAGIRRIKATVE